MNDATVSPEWPLRHACLVVDWDGYDGMRPLSKNAVHALRDDCPVREMARHDASARSIGRG
jgi:hypothetical protein